MMNPAQVKESNDCSSSQASSCSSPIPASPPESYHASPSTFSPRSTSTATSNALGPTLLAIGVILIISKTHAARARGRLQSQRLSTVNYKAQANTLRSFLFNKKLNPHDTKQFRQFINRTSLSNGERAMDRVRSNEYPRSWIGSLSPRGGLKKKMDDEWEQQLPKQSDLWSDFGMSLNGIDSKRKEKKRKSSQKDSKKEIDSLTPTPQEGDKKASSIDSSVPHPPQDWGDWIMASPYRPPKNKSLNPGSSQSQKIDSSPSKSEGSTSPPVFFSNISGSGEENQPRSFRSHYPTSSRSASPSLALGGGSSNPIWDSFVKSLRSTGTPKNWALGMNSELRDAVQNHKNCLRNVQTRLERLKEKAEFGDQDTEKSVQRDIITKLDSVLTSIKTSSNLFSRESQKDEISKVSPSFSTSPANSISTASGSSSPKSEEVKSKLKELYSQVDSLEHRIKSLESRAAKESARVYSEEVKDGFAAQEASLAANASVSDTHLGGDLQKRLSQVEEELKFTKERALMLGLWADEMGRKFKSPFNHAGDSK